jgi:hypothetical protein
MACDFAEPFNHSAPVHHGAVQRPSRDWPDACVWAQLQYERSQHGKDPGNYTSTAYLANLGTEWARRAICSRCHRDIDRSLDEQMTELECRAHDAEEKLARIRRLMAVTSDANLRPELMNILDRQ